MSFTANKELPKVEVTNLVRLRPRRRLRGWITDISEPNIHRVNWSENVVGLLLDSAVNYLDQEDSEADCLANPDSFFHDVENRAIVLNTVGDPNFGFLVIEWDVFLASRDLRWFIDPTNAGSGDRFWSGGIVQAPAPTQGNQDLIFGYSPIQITNLRIQVANGFLFEHLHEWSLLGSSIKAWVCIGELRTENISELFTGVGGNMSMVDGELAIDVQDPLKLLDAEYEGDRFSVDTFANLDPADEGAPIREVFGFLRSFLPVNIDFDEPAVDKNRDWVVCKGEVADAPVLASEIDTSMGAVNDEFTTTVLDASYFASGDDIIVEAGGGEIYVTCVGTDLANNQIFHTSVGLPRIFSPGNQVRRSFIAQVKINWSDPAGPPGNLLEIPLKFGRDWNHSDFAGDTRGFVLVDDFEANIVADGFTGFPTFDPASMVIWCRVYGGNVLPKKYDGITDFGQLTARGGTAGNPVVILWDMLRNRIRTFRELITLDEPAWSAMALAFDRPIGLAVPEQKNGDFPTWKEIAQLLLQTELLRMHFRVDGGTSTLTITQTSMAEDGGRAVTDQNQGNAEFFWDFSDIYSRLVMELNFGELESAQNIIDVNTVYLHPDMSVEFSPMRAAAYVHRVDKTFSFRSLFAFSLDDQSGLVAMRLAKIIGERRGTIAMRLPVGFLEESIDDNASVQLQRLTGFPVTAQTRTRNYKLAQHAKSAEGVNVILDDQKGIQDSGRWE